MKSVKVTCETREIKAEWKRELADDLSAFHPIDTSEELRKVLEEELKKSPEFQAKLKREQREKKLKRILGDEL